MNLLSFIGLSCVSRRGTVFCLVLLPFCLRPARAVQLESSPQVSVRDSVHSFVGSLIAEGDVFASEYFDNRKALMLYNRALKIESTNADLLWHISKAYVEIGDHLPTITDADKERQLATYTTALEFAQKSVTAEPGNSMALTRRAIALSRSALFKGFWETVGLMKDIRADLEEALAADSTNDLAFYTLAKTHLWVIERPWIFRWPLGLGWGSREEAILLFEKAIDLKSDFVAYRLECAKALTEEGEYERAKAHLRLIPELPTQAEDDEQYRTEAQALFELIKDE